MRQPGDVDAAGHFLPRLVPGVPSQLMVPRRCIGLGLDRPCSEIGRHVSRYRLIAPTIFVHAS